LERTTKRMLPTMGFTSIPSRKQKAKITKPDSQTMLSQGLNYGRRASISPNVQAHSRGKMIWESPPESILIIRKLDLSTTQPFIQLAKWLINEKKMNVFVEEKTLNDSDFDEIDEFSSIKKELQVFCGTADSTLQLCVLSKIDIIVCLGGDGTLLYASSLFNDSVPPIMSFNLGSLGFLTPYNFDNFKSNMESLFHGNMEVIMRSRLRANVRDMDSEELIQAPQLALNEVTIDRGPSHYICNLELYVNDRLVCPIQGDGLIISTPTGSTAYAASAGAGMVHPLVPAILITPICPHTLNSRPIVVPSESVLKVKIAPEARHSAYISIDGRRSVELSKGRELEITTSEYSLPTIAKEDQDWFSTLQEMMNWNVRARQKKIQTKNKTDDK